MALYFFEVTNPLRVNVAVYILCMILGECVDHFETQLCTPLFSV